MWRNLQATTLEHIVCIVGATLKGVVQRRLNDDHCPFTGKQCLLMVFFGPLYAASTV